MLRKTVVAELVWFGDGKNLDEEIGELHHMIVRAPRMPVARADLEASAAIEIRSRIEIANGMNDVIETASHDQCASAPHFTAEKAVGARI